MLMNNKGKVVTPVTNPKNREGILKGLREKLDVLPPKCGNLFKLGTRAIFKERCTAS